MIETKLYLYDSDEPNYEGEDLSKYILVGDNSDDPLNEELGVVKLTLAKMPKKEEFAPSTKMIYEKWQDGILYSSWSLVVDTDLVVKPVIANDGIYDHHIDFLEASAMAQGRVVDNISVTYKLQDVSLDNNIVIENPDAKVKKTAGGINSGDDYPVLGTFVAKRRKSATKWNYTLKQAFKLSFGYDTANTFDYYQNVDGSAIITINLPNLNLYVEKGITNNRPTFDEIGQISYDVVIERSLLSGGNREVVTSFLRNAGGRKWQIEYPEFFSETSGATLDAGYVINNLKETKDVNEMVFTTKKIAEFTDNPLTTYDLEIKPNYKYYVSFIPHDFTSGVNQTIGDYDAGKFAYYNNTDLTWHYFGDKISGYTNNSRIGSFANEKLEFMTYDKQSTETFLHTAPPVSCYDLFRKCQQASQDMYRPDIYYSCSTMPLTFYVSKEDEELLRRTPIVENFYHQKNLWQMFIEIGKYIHSIPRIVFGDDDRLLVKWEKLGKTEQNVLYGNEVTIYNSKALESYISACSSYVNNAVQIGGEMDEIVMPKSTSEDYLVSNDTAKIITSKPIIEILKLEAILVSGSYTDANGETLPIGTTKSLSGGDETAYKNGFVFAKEVYDILPITEEDKPAEGELNPLTINKSRAIWYKLGTNEIQGLNYRLPTVSAGDTEGQYAIKKILILAFNLANNGEFASLWNKVYVNDFAFHIVYRTKDELRSEQSRPDLRKYLLNSKYDTVPMHKQFNNQEDIVVDSTKLGNNIYGKLIKTGNTEYTIVEWVNALDKLSKSGDLLNIDGKLFYVAKVKNTYYSNHVISELTLSQDYNQLSEIIGIPSEPRFYEISEQSSIKRDICFNNYLTLTDFDDDTRLMNAKYLINTLGWKWIRNKIMPLSGDSIIKEPTNVITIFKNDIDNKYGDVPSNEVFKKFIYSTLNRYAFHNTLSFEWDMVDNFSAGDQIGLYRPVSVVPNVDSAYNGLLPVSYKDVYGRVDLVDFVVCDNYPTTYKTTTGDALLPYLPEIPEQIDGENVRSNVCSNVIDDHNYFNSRVYGNTYYNNNHGIVVNLDNRETFKGNFNIQLLTSSDRFVISSYFWNESKQMVKIALLNHEVNKIVNETIPTSYIIKTIDIPTSAILVSDYIILDIGTILANEDLSDVKAIAIVDTKIPTYDNPFNPRDTFFVCAKNVGGLDDVEKRKKWAISYVDTTFFKKQ